MKEKIYLKHFENSAGKNLKWIENNLKRDITIICIDNKGIWYKKNI
jgi:hypothetical protein